MTGPAAGSAAEVAGTPPELDSSTYEVLRARLTEQARELLHRTEELNAQRLKVFGGADFRLLGTARVRTENNCVPRDIVSLGEVMLFGYNVFIGLKSATTVRDVFSFHRFSRDGDTFRFDEVPGLFDDPQFERDFGELYRYYSETRLLQLRKVEGRLLAVFQTGPQDVRVLRWSVESDGTIQYLDNRGERDHVFPPSHDFEWIETTRDDHVLGRHPHISIADELFVETVGGDLTIKIENNTETGEGIYREPVAEPLQSLADADVHHARVGPLILLRVRPYNEKEWRYLVFNTRTRNVERLDGIGQACQRLPEDQGIIFPGGYHLTTGVVKTFDLDVADLEFERVIRSPNGEDVLYVFHARAEGRSLLLPYNVIRKEVSNPITCHGYSLFEDGTLVYFRMPAPVSGEQGRAVPEEPTRVHLMQIWQTPYVSDVYAAGRPVGTGPLERIGNADLVRGISDCLSVVRMADAMAPSVPVFEGLIAACVRITDQYHWLDEHDLRSAVGAVRGTAEQVLDEFERVESLTGQAAAALDEAAERIALLVRQVRGEAPRAAGEWVGQLAELRREQGRLATLREVRYVDVQRVDALAGEFEAEIGEAARRAVDFLRGADAFTGYHAEVDRLVADAQMIGTVAEAGPVGERLAGQTEGLEVLTEVVGGLDIADATVRTGILERVAEVLAGINRARATLAARRRELLAAEGRAEFAAEFALLGQAVTAALALADTPESCDEQMGRLLLRLEDLESRFGDFDDFVEKLSARRGDVYEAFSSRRQTLLDVRARRAERLVTSAGRILESVHRRAASLGSIDEVNTYFASDPMVAKLRSVAEELRSLGDQVRADELDGRVKAARLDAGRALRDRLDLYADGGETIRLGRHRFAVNTQQIDLTLVPMEGRMAFAITGTDYRSPVEEESFHRTRTFWDQVLVSESPEVYRAEHLATSILDLAESSFGDGLTLDALHAALADGGLLDIVRRVAETRYDEGYERGVHDHDAAAILGALLPLHAGAGLLRFPPAARAAAQLFWTFGTDEAQREAWTTRARSLARARSLFGYRTATPDARTTAEGDGGGGGGGGGAEAGRVEAGRDGAIGALRAELGSATAAFLRDRGLRLEDAELAGDYLFEELAGSRPGSAPRPGPASGSSGSPASAIGGHAGSAAGAHPGFTTGPLARLLLERFREALGGSAEDFDDEIRALGDDLAARHQLVVAWLTAFLGTSPDLSPRSALTGSPAAPVTGGAVRTGRAVTFAAADVRAGDLAEAVAVQLCDLPRHEPSAALTVTVDGLLGAHPRLAGRSLTLRLDEALARTRRFRTERVPAYRAYQRQRGELLDRERARLRLDEYRPKVMSAFVRNRLLDEVYLPLVGDNLAKQLGAAGEGKRTDQMGLLLLISPPGYGKTTLMEYVASRLGLVFVKINGPALGHAVTSLDPADAPNATARQEIEKVSFALECGNNVLLYLDDIQHTSPELLQKFISLCDAQRRMEGVWNGGTRTYDLRGKRFAVCMAGNPYTESGRRFRVPDMLANRADVWNLGDVLSGRDDLFSLSYIENALTSNPVLAPLSTRDRADVELLVRLARGDADVRADQLTHPYPKVELDQIVAVLRRLSRVQQVVLAANQAYIASAAQADSSRTEPPFRLQGSYRNMNKLTERIVPVMNDAEIEALIDDHYVGEAQTLTSEAEANLLKLAELRGRMTAEQQRRWAEVKAGYLRAQALGGEEDNPVVRAVGAIGLLADRVGGIEQAIHRATESDRDGGME
ncbi:DNA repair ATPase [Microtetraspora sp. AC03309]|uniref:DNA repair ATPase n=1 Tax=Microtetraspora sp. AC03309 TaxID=2779376 RepID=UPI001E38993A|nr:DNA repair ATPase [Microtetraspora sp. AC03309]MCC5574197.1 DNA repair ATPase [Microtetraspora sp. AC03309]